MCPVKDAHGDVSVVILDFDDPTKAHVVDPVKKVEAGGKCECAFIP